MRDARGIFCRYVCDKCEAEARRTYRRDVLTDPNYAADDLGDDTDTFGQDTSHETEPETDAL